MMGWRVFKVLGGGVEGMVRGAVGKVTGDGKKEDDEEGLYHAS